MNYSIIELLEGARTSGTRLLPQYHVDAGGNMIRLQDLFRLGILVLELLLHPLKGLAEVKVLCQVGCCCQSCNLSHILYLHDAKRPSHTKTLW